MDATQTERLLYGEERSVHADAGYTDAHKCPGMAGRDIEGHVVEKCSRVQVVADDALPEFMREAERIKAA
jgi:IS5 family transposase